MIYKLIVANGIYDIICGVCILKNHNREPHLDMFIIQLNPDSRRFLAYWIITYGIIRLMANHRIAAITYFIEAALFEYERTHFTLVPYKVSFVTFLSITMGLFTLAIPY